jgi:hypothetical protein
MEKELQKSTSKGTSMPTLLREKGFTFFFYANEHEPEHIHIMKGDEYAKIELIHLRVVKNTFKKKELSNALKIVNQNVENFKRKWNEYFNSGKISKL